MHACHVTTHASHATCMSGSHVAQAMHNKLGNGPWIVQSSGGHVAKGRVLHYRGLAHARKDVPAPQGRGLAVHLAQQLAQSG